MISIVVPVYNAGYSIYDCIISVENNDFEDWELILVDDCSTDNTVNTIRRILCDISDERITLIALTKNVRAGGARNRGIIEAKGEYIFFWIRMMLLLQMHSQHCMRNQRMVK